MGTEKLYYIKPSQKLSSVLQEMPWDNPSFTFWHQSLICEQHGQMLRVKVAALVSCVLPWSPEAHTGRNSRPPNYPAHSPATRLSGRRRVAQELHLPLKAHPGKIHFLHHDLMASLKRAVWWWTQTNVLESRMQNLECLYTQTLPKGLCWLLRLLEWRWTQRGTCLQCVVLSKHTERGRQVQSNCFTLSLSCSFPFLFACIWSLSEDPPPFFSSA